MARPAVLDPPRSRLRRVAVLSAAAGLAGLLAAPAAHAGIFAPEAETVPASDIRELYWLVMALAVIIFVGVEGVLIFCLRRYKARKGAVAAQIHGNTRLEIGWTVGAAVILVFITVFTFIKLPGIVDPAASTVDAEGNPLGQRSSALYAATDQAPPPPGSDPLVIRVDGQQYVWRFQYPGEEAVFSYVEMVVPVGRTVVLEITADDVAHSWWIPALGGKADALPGYVNKSWFRVDEPGEFPGQCAELCGRNHANMLASVRALPNDEYQRWYDDKAQEIARARELAAEQRRRLEGETADAIEGGIAAGEESGAPQSETP